MLKLCKRLDIVYLHKKYCIPKDAMGALKKIKSSCTSEKPSLLFPSPSFLKPLKLKEILCPFLIETQEWKNRFHI